MDEITNLGAVLRKWRVMSERTLREVAAARSATAAQVALAWLLKRDDHVIPIPGATRPEHVRENSGALSLELSDEEFGAIDRASAPTPAR